jgi:hypothetical protein
MAKKRRQQSPIPLSWLKQQIKQAIQEQFELNNQKQERPFPQSIPNEFLYGPELEEMYRRKENTQQVPGNRGGKKDKSNSQQQPTRIWSDFDGAWVELPPLPPELEQMQQMPWMSEFDFPLEPPIRPETSNPQNQPPRERESVQQQIPNLQAPPRIVPEWGEVPPNYDGDFDFADLQRRQAKSRKRTNDSRKNR